MRQTELSPAFPTADRILSSYGKPPDTLIQLEDVKYMLRLRKTGEDIITLSIFLRTIFRSI